jgi:hypothetical protein
MEAVLVLFRPTSEMLADTQKCMGSPRLATFMAFPEGAREPVALPTAM